MQDLKLFSTEELLDEVKSRFDNAVFIGKKEGKTVAQRVIFFGYNGDLMYCQGLCNLAQAELMSSHIATRYPIDLSDF